MTGGISELISVINQLNIDAQQNSSAQATFEFTSGLYSVEATSSSYVLPYLDAGTTLHIIGNGAVIERTTAPTNNAEGFMYTRGQIIIENLTFQNWTNWIFYPVSDPNDNSLKLTRFVDCTFKDNMGIGTGFYIGDTTRDLEVVDCEFINNQGPWLGGAFYANVNSALIEGCLFQDNTAQHGGAIDVSTGNGSGQTIVKNCEFIQNTATDGEGGAMRHAGDLTVLNTLFDGNSAIDFNGGAISCRQIDIKNCTFKNNKATYYGGALYSAAGLDGLITVKDCLFELNESTEIGTAFYAYTDTDLLVCNNNEFIGNFTTSGPEKPIIYTNILQSDFRNNYWNADDGPEEEGVSNTGSGELVPNGLNFVPWLSKGEPGPHDGENIYPFAHAASDPLTTINPNSLQGAEKRLYETDLRLAMAAGEMTFTRLYRQKHQSDFGFMGLGWYHNHHIYLETDIYDKAKIYLPGVILELADDGTGVFTNDGSKSKLTVTATDGSGNATEYELLNHDFSKYTFEVLDSSNPDKAYLVEHQFPTSQIWTYSYDTQYRLSTVLDSYGRGLSFAYYTSTGFEEGKLKIVSVVHPTISGNLPSVSLAYTENASNQALLTTVTDARGEDWTYEYYTDATWENYLKRRLSPPVNGTEIVLEDITYHGSKAQIDKIEQARGDGSLNTVTAYFYQNGVLTDTTEYAVGISSIQMKHEFVNNFRTATIDGAGNVLMYIENRDSYLNIPHIANANGYGTRQIYTDDGRDVERIVNAQEVGTTFEYDTAHRLNKLTDALHYETEFTYPSGSVEIKRQPATIIRRDIDSNKSIVQRQHMAYDAEGRVISQSLRDPLDENIILDLSSFNYEVGTGLVQRVVFDDTKEATLQGRNVTTELDYDVMGRVVKSSKTSMYGTCEFTYRLYDNAGLLLGQACGVADEDPVETLTELEALYDANDVKKQYTRITLFEYDEAGRQLAVKVNAQRPDTERSMRLVYDGLGRVVMHIENYVAGGSNPPEYWVWENDAWHDAPISLSGKAIYHGANKDLNIVRQVAYNKRGLVRLERDRIGNVTLFGYDDADRLVRTVQYASDAAYTNDYDNDYSLSLYPHNSLQDQDVITDREYDPVGNLTKVIVYEADGTVQETQIAYDELNRACTIIQNPSRSDYKFSSTGKILPGYTVSSNNPDTNNDDDVIVENVYDNLGRLIEERRLIKKGVLSNGVWDKTHIVYDALGRERLIVQHFDGSGNPREWVWENDAWRVKTGGVAVNHGTDNDQNLVSGLVYDSDNNLSETIAADGTRTRYVYNGVDQRIAEISNCKLIAPFDLAWNGTQWTNNAALVLHGALGDENIITHYEYEDDNSSPNHGRLAETRFVDGVIDRIVYDTAGRTLMRIGSYEDQVTHPQSWAWNATNQTWDSSLDVGVARGSNADVNLINRVDYDDEDRVTQVRDHLGNLTVFVYDKLGRQRKQIVNYEAQNASDPSDWYPSGNQWLDGGGQAINHGTDNDQNLITAMSYDLNGQMITMYDSSARETHLIRDHRGLLIEQIENYGVGQSSNNSDNLDQSLTTRFLYDKLGRLITVTDPEGNLLTSVYDKVNRLIKQIRVSVPNSYEQVMTYDRLNNLKQVVNQVAGAFDADQITSYLYDAALRVKEVKDGVGNATKMRYNLMGSLIELEDPDGAITRYLYDSLQRQYRVIQNYVPQAKVPEDWVWENDAWHVETGGAAVIHGTDNDQNIVVHMRLQANGNVLEITAPKGDNSLYGYDKLRRPVSMQNVLGYTWSTIFQDANRKSQRTLNYPGINTGGLSQYSVVEKSNRVGRLAEITYGNPGQTPDVRFAYDVRGNGVQMSEYGGINFSNLQRQTNLAYDGVNRVVQTQFDENGNGTIDNTIEYAYNRVGLRTRMSLPDGQDSYLYDRANQLNRLVDRFGQKTVIDQYDANGYPRHMRRVSEDGIPVDSLYNYDKAGRLTQVAHGSLQEPAITLANFEYTLDKRGNRDYVDEQIYDFIIDDVLDGTEVNRARGTWTPVGTTLTSTESGATLEMQVTGAARQLRLTYGVGIDYSDLEIRVNGQPHRSVHAQHNVSGTRTLVINLRPQAGNHTLEIINLVENAARPKAEFIQLEVLRLQQVSQHWDYAYDDLSRLTSADDGSTNLNYDYDVAGNLINMAGVARSYNAANQMTQEGSASLVYDPNGNLISDGAHSYAWDRANRLVNMDSAQYSYDGWGNRVAMSSPVNGNDRDVSFLLDLMSAYPTVVRETYTSLGVSFPQETRHFVHGLTGVQTQYLNGARSHLLQDGLGTVRMHTDNAGVPNYTMNPLPYGAGGAHGFGFTGEYTDPNDLLYLRARYYDPARGIFLSRDTYPGSTGMPMSMNRYSYAEGNPALYADPSGHFVITGSVLLGLAIGAAVGATVGGLAGFGLDASIQYLTTGQVDWAQSRRAGVEGAILGAISGLTGGALTALGYGARTVSALSFGIDAAVGTAWDMNVHGDSLGMALFSNIALAGLIEGGSGMILDGLSDATRRAFRGADIDAPRSRQLPAASCSFSADTLVQTPDGEKNIADISAGDAIMGYNEGADEVDVFVVTATHKQVHSTTLDVTIEGEIVHTTEEHPFLIVIEDELQWTEAKHLNIGDTVLAADGSTGTVEAVQVVDEPQVMYNLTVDLVATYLVGEQGWIVHNVDTPAPQYMLNFGWFKYRGVAWEYTQRDSPISLGRLPIEFDSWFIDKKGKRLPNINGKPPINWRYSGGNYTFRKGSLGEMWAPRGIDFDVMGFPIFDPFAIAIAKIDARGNTYGDFIASNMDLARQLGLDLNNINITRSKWRYLHHETHSKHFVWHHVQDGKTMLLLPHAIHSKTRIGGVKYKGVAHTGYEAIVDCII